MAEVPYKSCSDSELVRLILDDNHRAYLEVYERYSPRLYFHACRHALTPGSSLARDGEPVIHTDSSIEPRTAVGYTADNRVHSFGQQGSV